MSDFTNALRKLRSSSANTAQLSEKQSTEGTTEETQGIKCMRGGSNLSVEEKNNFDLDNECDLFEGFNDEDLIAVMTNVESNTKSCISTAECDTICHESLRRNENSFHKASLPTSRPQESVRVGECTKGMDKSLSSMERLKKFRFDSNLAAHKENVAQEHRNQVDDGSKAEQKRGEQEVLKKMRPNSSKRSYPDEENSFRDAKATAVAQDELGGIEHSELSSTLLQAKPSSYAPKRRFPGPAGLLPLPHQLPISTNMVLSANVSCNKGPDTKSDRAISGRSKRWLASMKANGLLTKKSSMDTEDNSLFTSGSWLAMLNALKLPSYNYACLPESMLNRNLVQGCVRRKEFMYNIKYIASMAVEKQIPFLLLVIKKLKQSRSSNCGAVFKDPTGEMEGTFHSKVLSQYRASIVEGASLALKNVTIFSPSSSKHYLNITPVNIVCVFGPERDTSAHSSPSDERLRVGENSLPESQEQSHPKRTAANSYLGRPPSNRNCGHVLDSVLLPKAETSDRYIIERDVIKASLPFANADSDSCTADYDGGASGAVDKRKKLIPSAIDFGDPLEAHTDDKCVYSTKNMIFAASRSDFNSTASATADDVRAAGRPPNQVNNDLQMIGDLLDGLEENDFSLDSDVEID
eukprot:Nk52_evm1s182 gene=Nk52_evmTU1s182